MQQASNGGFYETGRLFAQVRPDKIAEYREHHPHVWPEMLEALQRTGWHNYSLFFTRRWASVWLF